jgi:hypothetical protein
MTASPLDMCTGHPSRRSIAAAFVTAASVILIALVPFACDGAETAPTSTPRATPATGPSGVLGEIPPETRISDGGTDPRTAGYWIAWSTCGEGSQADVAAANGGRAAGWILLDDILTDPGVYLGDHRLTTCTEAIDILDAEEDDLSRLAAALLTADLNLSVGSESCTAAEGAVRVARVTLGAMGYGGPGVHDVFAAGDADLLRETIVLLDLYSRGELCREG